MNKFWDLAPPLLIGMAVDVVVMKEESLLGDLGYTDPWTQLIILSLLTFGVWVLESMFEYWFGILWRNLAQTVQHEMRMDAFTHVEKQGMGWFDERQKGDLLAIMNDDINQLERFLDKGANDILQVATTVVIVGAIFFVISWNVAIFAFLPIPIIIWGSFLYQRKLEPRYAEVRTNAGRLNALLENDLSGMSTIQSFTAEEMEASRVEEVSNEYRNANKKAIRLSAAFVPLIRMAILCGFTATLLIGGKMTLDGEMAVGAYSVLVFMTQRLLWPLTRLGETFDLYQRAMASSNRILDLIETPVSLIDGDFDPKRKDVVQSSIKFENCTFSYPGREAIFSGLNLEITPGSTVGVVGATGAGKTTLLRMMLRFCDPISGKVEWCGKGLEEWKLESLRSSIALVEQNVTLFPATIKENILYGKPNASDAEVEEAAKVAEISGFIDTLPEGWSTLIGEGGKRLSGGQRQRLAIARAIIKDAPLLILDEATSAVDNETEAALQRSIQKISNDRTTLIVAHRLSTIRNADEIIVLDNGKIVEKGTHDILLNHDGVYAKLWSVQTGSMT
tara:strand:- start:214 stop:1899 length:1686 start_codon:yes stop_codon:yes gene_type:complete